MNNINGAFDRLRKVLPGVKDRDLSKFESLQMAQQYILELMEILQQDLPQWILNILHQISSPTLLKIFIAVILILGIYLRFINIDHKVYWFDETITSLRIVSYTRGEFEYLLSNSGTITVFT